MKDQKIAELENLLGLVTDNNKEEEVEEIIDESPIVINPNFITENGKMLLKG